MVKNFAMVVAVVGSLMMAGQAQAFGHRGCKSCGGGGGGGCPGGTCSVPMGSEKQVAATNAPPGIAPAPAVVSAQPAPTYFANTARRGLFGRR